ncbi:MAG: hypothetical protein NVSMB21_23640 [Vulcanimicrobiaceae bacterium]
MRALQALLRTTSLRRSALVASAVLATVFATVDAPPRAATAAMADGKPVAGIRCDTAEGAVFHIHQHVTILERGRALAIPDDIGRPLAASCLYWLHTHSADGLVHVEAPKFRTFTLGNLFDIWGEPLSATAVASARIRPGALRVYVGGRPYKGDPRKIELSQHTDITLEAGAPYVKPTPFTDWKGQ